MCNLEVKVNAVKGKELPMPRALTTVARGRFGYIDRREQSALCLWPRRPLSRPPNGGNGSGLPIRNFRDSKLMHCSSLR